MAAVVHLRLDKELLASIDEVVKSNPLFASRSEYIRVRLREDVVEDRKKLLDEMALEIREMVVKRGANTSVMTRKEKAEIADEFFKKTNFT